MTTACQTCQKPDSGWPTALCPEGAALWGAFSSAAVLVAFSLGMSTYDFAVADSDRKREAWERHLRGDDAVTTGEA